jgi:hypothetical protein
MFTAGSYSAALAPGAISASANGVYTFNGVAGGANLNLVILRTTMSTFLVTARVSGFRLASDPTAVGLAIGNDAGTTTAR